MFAYLLHTFERIADYCWTIFPEAFLGATLILLIAALANLALIRAGAALRHRIWSLAALSLLIFPVLGMILPKFHFDYGRLFASSEVAQSETAQTKAAARTEPAGFGGMIYSPPTGEGEYAIAQFAPMPPPISPVSNDPPAAEEPASSLKLGELPWRKILLSLWAAGIALGIVSYAKSHLGARLLAKNSLSCVAVPWLETVNGIGKRLGLRTNVRIAFSRETASPLTLGWLKPTILLPAHCEGWPDAQRLAVLVHEMSHIARRDVFWQNIARAAGILYWFHPLMWLALWRMRVERELACDDAVINFGERPSNYASLLLEVAAAITGRTRKLHGGVAMACRSSVERRIASILNPDQTHTPVGRRASWAMFAAAACVVALGAMFNPVAREQPADAAANVADMQADKPDESSLGEVPQDQEQNDTADETVVQDSQNNQANNQKVPIGGMMYQPSLAFMGFGGYAEESPTNKPENKGETPERTLKFPDDRSLGQLSVRDEKFERTIDNFIYCSSDASWQPLCEARGAVKVPAGKVVQLKVTEQAARDLSPLLKLGANDLHKLDMFFVPAEDQVMQHVAHLSGLKELDLEGSSIRDRGMAYIDQLKSLEYLRLPNNITDKGLPAVSKLPHLKGLYFKNTRVTNNGLRAISKLKTLEELELGGVLDDDGLEHIVGLPKLSYLMLCGEYTGSGFKHLRKIPTLKIVNLEHNPQNSDAGLEQIAALPNLENLTLRDNPLISDKGMAFLARSRSLKKLEISKTQVTARGVEYLANIESLEYLCLPDSSLTDDALAHVGRLKNLKVLGLLTPYYFDPRLYEKYYTAKGVAELDGLEKLEDLSISGPGIDDESAKHIAKHTRLKKLNIWGPQLGNKGLRELVKLQSLECLELPFGNITLGGLAALNDLPHLKSLKVLKVVDDGLAMDIGGCTELESLTLWMDRVNTTDDDDLACLEKLKKLKEFNSSISRVGDAGMAHLAGLTDLKFLAVGGQNVTDAGLAHLSNLKKLNILHIFGNISDAGLKAFKGLHCLQLLDINSTQNISPAAIKELEQALPGTDRIIVEHISNLAGQPKSLRFGDAAPPLSVKDDEGEGGGVIQKSDSTTAAPIGGVQKVSMTVSAEAADADQTKKSTTSMREIKFPDDRSLGQLSVRDEKFERTIDDFLYYCPSDTSWQPLCEARGAVKVPAGKVVKLSVTEQAARDLSPLLKLEANDLYRLDMIFVPAKDQAMQHVAHLSALKEIDLLGCTVGDAGMAYIDRLKSLEYLTLPEKVTDKGLSAVSKLPHLKGLYFTRTQVTNDGLRAISKMKTLEELELGGDIFTDGALEHISELSKLSYICLWRNFTGSGFKNLRKLTALKIVNLYNNPQLSDAALQHVAALPKLENLMLYNDSRITDKGMDFLAKAHALKKLVLGGTQVTVRGMEHLADIKSIEYLHLPDSSLSDEGLAIVGRLKNLKVLSAMTPYFNDPSGYDKFYTAKGVAELDGLENLEELSISGPGIDDESVKHIAKHMRLKILSIWGLGLGNKGLRELSKLQSLEYLAVPHGQVTLGGLSVLSDLPHLKALQVLKLVDDGLPMDIGGCTELENLTISMGRVNTIDDDDLACLEKLKKLKEFQSGNSLVGNAGLAHLRGLTDLRVLNVGSPNITDAGLVHLSNLKRLGTLYLRGNITDVGLNHLKGLHCLTYLEIQTSKNISDAAIEDLKKALPGTNRINVAPNKKLTAQMKPQEPGEGATQLLVKDVEGKEVATIQKADSASSAPVMAVQNVSMTVSADAADADRTKSSHAPAREIKFPDDRSLGRFYVRDENFKRVIDGFFYHTADGDWKSLGEARGTVKIPADKVVRLAVSNEAAGDLSPLSKLGPNDLHTLEISWVPADDRAMQYVAHLGGLKNLCLFDAPIGDKGMAYVERLKSLEYLTLPKNITDKGLPVVNKLPRLKGLYFKTNRITNDGLKVLSKLNTLEELELGGDLINDDGLKYIAGLPKLNYLLLFKNFTGSGFNHLKNIPTLRVVNLFRMKTTQDAGLEHIAAMPALENLSLYDNNQISDQGMAYLASSKSLRKLNIGLTQVTARGVEYLSKIKTLEELDLPDASMTDAGLESLSRLNKLKVLDATMPHFNDLRRYDKFYTEKGLAALDKLEELEFVGVGGPAVNDESIKHIATRPHLKKLMITGSALGDAGLKELAKLQSLESLDLRSNHVSFSGLAALNGLPHLKSLDVFGLIDDGRPLDIGGCKELERFCLLMAKGSTLRDEDLKCLQNLKKLKELQTGNISEVGDAGLACLGGLTELEVLTIGSPNVTDAGLEHLANLNKLWHLNIYGNISGEGLQKLKGSNLNILRVTSGQNISQKAVDKFKKSMPGEVQVTINYY
jgi:beta-lactamase regulating signal transducer with metallopeptidase domain/Leucine-rich repeat (LRR) protein